MNTAIVNGTFSNGSNVPTAPAGFHKRKGGEIMDCHRQWASRPADEAVMDIRQLLDRTRVIQAGSTEYEGVSWDSLAVEATYRGDLVLSTDRVSARLNNYSLAQLCALPGDDGGIAPHSFLTKLSADCAAQVLTERLKTRIGRKNPASLLVQRAHNGLPSEYRSINTEAYERIWNHDLALRVETLASAGTWGPAEAFRRANGINHDRALHEGQIVHPLGWVGDRNMFLCLVDYEGGIEHKGSTFARFLLLSNSEVGAGCLKITFGLMDFACSNFILWGCEEVYEASFRHTKNVHDKWAQLSGGLDKRLASENKSTIIRGIEGARGYMLGDDSESVIKAVQAATTLPKGIVSEAYNTALGTPRYGDARSVWGMVNGLTEVSQTRSQNADKRLAIDTAAASLMGLVRAA